MSNIVYWKKKDGVLVSVDDMDTNHLKNSLKMLIKRHKELAIAYNTLVSKINKHSFELKGDMAQEFNNTYIADDYTDELDNDVI